MSKARDLANAGTALTTVSATELGYLDGVTSNVQTQINTKDSLPLRTGQSGKYLTNNGTDASWGTVESLGAKSISVASGLSRGPYTYTNTFAAGGYFISQGNDTGAGSVTVGSITNTATTKGGVLSTSTTGATVDLTSIVRYGTGDAFTDSADARFLAYGNGVFVTGSSNDRLRTSTNSVTWTTRTAPGTGFDYDAGASLPSLSQKYVIGGSAGYLASSTDAVTWTSRTSQFGTSRINKIIAGDGIYLAAGFFGKVSTSTDGITWTSRSTGTQARLTSIMYAPDKAQKYVIVGGSTATITSTDGATWVERTGPSIGGAALEKAAYGNGIYLAAGQTGVDFGYSTDGITWSVVTRPNSNLEPRSLDFINGYFLYSSASDSTFSNLPRHYISTNGTAWTDITLNVNNNPGYPTSQFVYASDQPTAKIVGVSQNGYVRRSPDFYGTLASNWSATIIGPMTNTVLS